MCIYLNKAKSKETMDEPCFFLSLLFLLFFLCSCLNLILRGILSLSFCWVRNLAVWEGGGKKSEMGGHTPLECQDSLQDRKGIARAETALPLGCCSQFTA